MPADPGSTLLSRRDALIRTAYLLGGAAAASSFGALLSACNGEGEQTAAATPTLTSGEQAIVASLAEHIIPETDTPGARAAGVPEFIAAVVAKHYSAADRALFRQGVSDVDARAQRAHGRPFLDCTPAEQVALLTELDAATYRPRRPAAPAPAPREGEKREAAAPGAGETPLPPEVEGEGARWRAGDPGKRPKPAAFVFWRAVKQLTLVGYYTSQPGATRELRHLPVPGRYDGCVPFAELGRSWA